MGLFTAGSFLLLPCGRKFDWLRRWPDSYCGSAGCFTSFLTTRFTSRLPHPLPWFVFLLLWLGLFSLWSCFSEELEFAGTSKVNLYHGPIYGSSGEQCTTSMDLDEAMLATRNFWFQPPDQHDDAWQPILDCYAEGTPWPTFPPPSDDVFFNTLLHTKDSAPGPDGLPYSAWRLLRKVTVMH